MHTSELLLFLLHVYNDISCRSEATWVVFEVAELNEKKFTVIWKYVDLTYSTTTLAVGA